MVFERFFSFFAASSCFVAGGWAWLGENSAQVGALFAAAGFVCMLFDRIVRCRRNASLVEHERRTLRELLFEIEERRSGEDRRSGIERRKSESDDDKTVA